MVDMHETQILLSSIHFIHPLRWFPLHANPGRPGSYFWRSSEEMKLSVCACMHLE